MIFQLGCIVAPLLVSIHARRPLLAPEVLLLVEVGKVILESAEQYRKHIKDVGFGWQRAATIVMQIASQELCFYAFVPLCV